MAALSLGMLGPLRALPLPPPVADYLRTGALTDDENQALIEGRPGQEGDLFAKYVMTHWPAVLDNLSALAPTLRQQELVIRALELLPADNYLAALSKLGDLKAQGRVSVDLLDFTLQARVPQRGLLAVNYQVPAVRELVKRFQHLLPTQDPVQLLLARILDGSQSSIDQDYFELHDIEPPPGL
jgi:hypothetical protein